MNINNDNNFNTLTFSKEKNIRKYKNFGSNLDPGQYDIDNNIYRHTFCAFFPNEKTEREMINETMFKTQSIENSKKKN